MLDHKKREQPGVCFENPFGSGRAWLLTQEKGPYILEPATALEQFCHNRQQLHHGLFELVTVSPSHIGYFGFRIISALGISLFLRKSERCVGSGDAQDRSLVGSNRT